MIMRKFTISIAGLLLAIGIHAQQYVGIAGEPQKSSYPSTENACIEFISNAELNINENSGYDPEFAGTTPEGKRLYRAICYVPDGDKKVFNISVPGGIEISVGPYLRPGEKWVYEVVASSIASIQPESKLGVKPVENMASVIISCKKELKIRSKTGKVDQTKSDNDLYVTEIVFDLSNPDTRTIEHVIELAGEDGVYVDYNVGVLSVKEAKFIMVLMMEDVSCYKRMIDRAVKAFGDGLYDEANKAYGEAKNCNDLPSGVTLDTEIRNMVVLKRALDTTRILYNQAEKLRLQEDWANSLENYQEAQKFRIGILRMNPNDSYCLQYEKIYAELKNNFPRIISGKVVDNTMMDANKQNTPIPGVFVLCKAYQSVSIGKDGKMAFKDEIPNSVKSLGKTDEKGEFKVYLPRNSSDEKVFWQLLFTEDDYFKKNTKSLEVYPNDADIQKDLVIRITPTRINNRK